MDRTTVRCKPRAPKGRAPVRGARPLYTGAAFGALQPVTQQAVKFCEMQVHELKQVGA